MVPYIAVPPYIGPLRVQNDHITRPLEEPLQIFVTFLSDDPIAFRVWRNDSIDTLRQKIQESEGVPPDQQLLVFGGKVLEAGTFNDNQVRHVATVDSGFFE